MKTISQQGMLAAAMLILACDLAIGSEATLADYRFANDPLASTSSIFQPRLGTYRYQVTWRGNTAGDITFTMDQRDQRYTLSLRGESNEHVDLVYRVRYQAISQLSVAPFLPLRSVYRENVKNDRKHFTADFHSDGRVSVIQNRNRPGRDPSQSTIEIKPEKFAVDALSGLALMMNTDWRDGMTLTFETIFGQDRFEATLRCVGRARMDVTGVRREAWVITVDMKEITDSSERPSTENNIDIATDAVRVYLSDDAHREILRLTASTPLGDVQVRLRGFTPLANR